MFLENKIFLVDDFNVLILFTEFVILAYVETVFIKYNSLLVLEIITGFVSVVFETTNVAVIVFSV